MRPNLLDNAYFVGGGSQQGGGQMPINQTGKTSWTGNASYVNVFDRWVGYVSGGGAEFKLTGEGLALPSFGSYVTALQRMPYSNAAMAGKTYTISAIIGDELITATGKVTATSVTTTFFSGKGSNGNQVRLRYSSTNGMYSEVYTPNGGVVVSYCKLEEEEGQTLAYQDSTGAWHRLPQPEDGDYAGQLAKCKLYLNRLATGGGAGITIPQSYLSGSAGTVYFPVPLDCPMRPGNPTIVSYTRMDIYSPSTGVVSDAVITAVNQGNCLVFQAVKSGLSGSGFILTLNNVLVSNEL